MSLALRSFVASHVKDVPSKSVAVVKLGPAMPALPAPVAAKQKTVPSGPFVMSDEERRELIRRKLQEYVELVNSGSN